MEDIIKFINSELAVQTVGGGKYKTSDVRKLTSKAYKIIKN